MTAKNKSDAKKELKATIKKLRSKLDRAETGTERLKAKLAKAEKANKKLEAHVTKLEKRAKQLEKAARTAKKPAPAKTTAPTAEAAQSGATPAEGQPVPPTAQSDHPDASWTVVRLRAEARARGVAGVSGKTKAQLLAALG